MRLKLSPLAFVAIALLAAFTIFITWKAKKLETAMRERADEPELLNQAAPAFDLPALDGQRVSLAAYHGRKKLVVSFWASWCGPCKMEMPVLREFYEQQKKNADRFELLAVSIDEERGPAERFASELKLPFPVLLDLESQTANAYGVRSIPSLFIIDESGKVIYGHTGFDPNLEIVLATRLGLKPMPKPGGADDGDSSD